MKARRYTLRRRAETQARTHQRIVKAAVELHRTLGPARTSLSSVAELAGVQRHTLYRHFPDEAALFRACREHFIAAHPVPDIARWREIRPGLPRVRAGLADLYRYFAANREMIGNVLRDADLVPVGGAFRAAMAEGAGVLAEEWRAPDRAALRAALRLATDFYAWRALADGAKLGPSEAAALVSRMVAGAGLGRDLSSRRRDLRPSARRASSGRARAAPGPMTSPSVPLR